VVGEGPGDDEIEANLGFVGASGELLWPLTRRFAGVDRDRCWVTNLCKYRLDDDAVNKLTSEEFAECRDELIEELTWIARPKRVLAVGTLAARALVGDAFTSMDACNGVAWTDSERGWVVVPCLHPAAALRGGGDGALGKTAQAVGVWGRGAEPVAPTRDPRWIAIDTEGWPDDPIMLTFAYRDDLGRLSSGVVYPESVPDWWGDTVCDGDTTIIWHNALWDWRVVEAMGVERPWAIPFEDTMERIYTRAQGEPQGLKDLAYRHLGVRMRTYESVVRPYWEEMVVAYAEGFVAAHTEVETLTKTGKTRKRPLVRIHPDAKPIKRATNPDTLAARLGFGPPSLRFVPREEAEAYAVEDAVMTLRLREVL